MLRVVFITFTILALVRFTVQVCPSQMVDFLVNFITNGDFQDPVVGPPGNFIQIPNGVANWSTPLAQIGKGTYYNPNWNTGQVAALDSGMSQTYVQQFNMNAVNKYFVQLKYAREPGVSPSTCGIRVLWNHINVLQQPTPQTDLVAYIQLDVFSIIGLNSLGIKGMGVDDGLGSTIDDVGVYPYIPTYRVDINGQCGCQNGFFSNGYHLQCIACNLLEPFCSQCSFVPDLGNFTNECLNNLTRPINCTYGTFQCTACQPTHYLNITGSCQLIVQFHEGINPIMYKSCNKFVINQIIKMLDFKTLSSISNNNSNATVESFTFQQTLKKDQIQVTINVEYLTDIPNQDMIFAFQYVNLQGVVRTSTILLTMRMSNIPLLIYDDLQCRNDEEITKYFDFMFILSYILLFTSIATFKLAGLQLFSVLQTAYLSLAFHDRVDIYLKSFTQFRFINGFNFYINQPIKNIPPSVNTLGYTDNFIFNINFMYGIIVLDLIIGGVLLIIGKFKKRQLIQKIGLYFLKYGFVFFFYFNALNIAFSIGVHFIYAKNQQTQLFLLGAIFALFSMLLFFAVIYVLEFTQQKYFGQYKSSLKQNYVNKLYLAISIFHRFAIGIFISFKSQQYTATLLIVAIQLTFIMYNLINLPFKNARENYRSNICHLTNLVILCVANYYRSMKLYMDIEQRGKIHEPAFIEIACISLCLLVTFVYFVYEVVMKVLKCIKNKKRNKEIYQDQKRKARNKNNKSKSKFGEGTFNSLKSGRLQTQQAYNSNSY